MTRPIDLPTGESRSGTAAEPRLRLMSPPAFDPPYDEDLAGHAPVVDGSLALAFPPDPSRLPLRLVPPAGGPGASRFDPDDDAIDDIALPDPRPWAYRLSQALVEVLAGVRSAAQLSRYATLEILQDLERATGRLGTRVGNLPARRPTVTSVHVCQPNSRVAEACAVIDTGGRRRALALRLEGSNGRWRCTALQIG
ncbi:MAG: hypothetical protein QOJ03_2568 [Frankiaceae bacterium]|jgi:hypothetical protein|nr:hypothetical protein [Frankiaceae bacterium]